ncbi:hypothetical protein CSW65_13430 [Streptococcus agalactiae]|nr:hypothetical protein CSW65_13430 [Streptococcus agalactiae]
MRSPKGLADSLLATKERWRGNKKALEAQGHFVMLADFPKSTKVIFFKMTSRTAPLLSTKKPTPKGRLILYQKK